MMYQPNWRFLWFQCLVVTPTEAFRLSGGASRAVSPALFSLGDLSPGRWLSRGVGFLGASASSERWLSREGVIVLEGCAGGVGESGMGFRRTFQCDVWGQACEQSGPIDGSCRPFRFLCALFTTY